MATDIGTETTITFGTSSFSMEITNIDVGSISRGAVKTSHMGTTTAHSYIPTDLHEPPVITVEGHLDTTTQPIISSAAETITITAPDSSTYAGSGFMTEFGFTMPLEDVMTATFTIQGTGTWTGIDS